MPGAFPDTGPGPDGRRSAEQWINAMGEDVSLVRMQIDESLREGADRAEIVRHLASAQKEAGRLVSDIRRFADEVHGVTQAEIDAERV